MSFANHCIVCSTKVSDGAVYCGPCKDEVAREKAERNAIAANAKHIRRPLQRKAANIVAYAVMRGEIQPATAYDCVDCGKPAVHYDHRDYEKPLDIQPVCRSCNLLRGPASPYKTEQTVDGKRIYIRKSKYYEHWAKRRQKIVDMHEEGWNNAQIARKMDLSRERVRQILNKEAGK